MDKSTFTVYWMYKGITPNALQFSDMGAAMTYMETLRRASAGGTPYSAITMCSEMSNHIGKVGVDSVIDGKTPDGIEYDWNKSSRIGKVKHYERTTLIRKEDEA